MWGSYHELHTSAEFSSDWSTFLTTSIQATSSPILYRFVTYAVFKALIKHEFELPQLETEEPRHPLSGDDESVLRYVAGYVCRKLCTRLESSSLSTRMT